MALVTIDVGVMSSSPDVYATAGDSTFVGFYNTCNGTGSLDTFQFYLADIMGSGDNDVKVGTWYKSGSTYYNRDYEDLGTISSGSSHTFTGLNCSVSYQDYIGLYQSVSWWFGMLDHSNEGIETSGDQFNSSFSSGYSTKRLLVYGEGEGEEPDISAPTVTTSAMTSIATTSATGNGEITATGGEDCTRRGFCYLQGTTGDPTTADSVVYDDGTFGTGTFSKSITGLSEDTSYRVRAYAVNTAGTGYGSTVDLKTLSGFIPKIIFM